MEKLFKDTLLAPLAQPSIWISLAWTDVVQSYRRTVLGPLWITASMVIFSLAMTLVYGALFGVPTREYAAYVVCGMIGWYWVSALVTEGGSAFSAYGGYVKGMPIDKAQFVWAVAFKQVIVLAHSMPVYLALIPLGIVELNRHTLLFPLAFVIIFAISIPVVAVLRIVYVQYREIPRLVSSSIVIVLLITPVFLAPEHDDGMATGLGYLLSGLLSDRDDLRATLRPADAGRPFLRQEVLGGDVLGGVGEALRALPRDLARLRGDPGAVVRALNWNPIRALRRGLPRL